ncbi:MAG: hypothetical protein HC933_14150 [Pleurocapsa sp. SU_196_0]|nr:hypothetical protein [Pleurocapsa sp. SU_196_0]
MFKGFKPKQVVMPDPDFIAQNSTFFENLLEHRFLFDLRRELVLRDTPELLNVLKSDVDIFGFDLVLAVGDKSVHVQMKTRSGKPPANPYMISEALWRLPNACVIWMLYSSENLEPTGYYLFGFPMPDLEKFSVAKRTGRRNVRMQQARPLTLKVLAELLFPVNTKSTGQNVSHVHSKRLEESIQQSKTGNSQLLTLVKLKQRVGL